MRGAWTDGRLHETPGVALNVRPGALRGSTPNAVQNPRPDAFCRRSGWHSATRPCATARDGVRVHRRLNVGQKLNAARRVRHRQQTEKCRPKRLWGLSEKLAWKLI